MGIEHDPPPLALFWNSRRNVKSLIHQHRVNIPQAFQMALQRHQSGRIAEAEALYRQILAAQPKHADTLHFLGVAVHQTGRHELAMDLIRQAIVISPNAAAHTNLGEVYRSIGRLDEAIANYRRALELKPDSLVGLLNLGNALREQGQLKDAIARFRDALELKPDYPEAHVNLGVALIRQGDFDEAAAAFRRALEMKPAYPEAHLNLGAALAGQGQLDEAVGSYRRAMQLKPENSWIHSNLIYALHFRPGNNNGMIAAECERWNRQFSDPVKRFILPHSNDRNPRRRLRIGYVSPDFRDHVVGRNVFPLFKRHDYQEHEIFCYSGVAQPDKLTEGFRKHAQHWRSTVGISDEALAEIIRRDGVDILVDLTQHLAGNRLPMFARRPAPIQVSFAGYPDSTGVEALEHRISDRYLEASSAGKRTGRNEQVCLIDSFWCYDPCGVEVKVSGLPAEKSESVTFGNLNNFFKINNQALSLWARVLQKVAGSRLLILAGAGSHRQRTLETLERAGVDRRRVEFAAPRPRREYLKLYHRLDMVLDTFPYNGHTTSLDALWMGVPVVSLAGETPVSRAGLSQLTNLGLPEWVAHSEQDFVTIASAFAGDLQRLAKLRSTLRHRMETSVLMDTAGFTRQVEQAYRDMWQAWCSAQSPIRND